MIPDKIGLLLVDHRAFLAWLKSAKAQECRFIPGDAARDPLATFLTQSTGNQVLVGLYSYKAVPSHTAAGTEDDDWLPLPIWAKALVSNYDDEIPGRTTAPEVVELLEHILGVEVKP